MFQIATEETFRDGQIIFGEGSSGDWIYVIESGAVELSKKVEGKKIVIEVLKSGDVFGEMAFIAHVPRTATAQAVGETTLGIIDRTFLDSEYNKLSQHFQVILKTLTLRLKKTTEAIVNSKIGATGGS
jgi:CRP/FNR family cyclic AMP-dependent transcriptional regulator